MNRAIVFAAQQFIGFELCKGLLNIGYHVIALDQDEIVKDIYEEKWLEIGRNANVSYQVIDQEIETNNQSFICFVPIYDYFTLNCDQVLNEWKVKFKQFCDKYINNIELFVLIIPNQILRHDVKKEYSDFHEIVLEVKEYIKGIGIKEIYVPTVYGPWQPDSLLFQQLISGNLHKEYRDDCTDAIYVEDAIQTIIVNIDEKTDDKTILLQSEEKNRWESCVYYLNESFNQAEKETYNAITLPTIVKVPEKTPYKEGLERQIRSFDRIKE